MKNKRLIPLIFGLILLSGAAAFMAGRMLNKDISPPGILGFAGGKAAMDVTINMIPAKELPTVPPDATGLFAVRKDNNIFIQTTSLKTGGQGIVVHRNEDGDSSPSSNMEYGPQVEVVITKQTDIYRDSTEPVDPSSNNQATIQQKVEVATLDDLTSQSFVSVWGRKSSDRIIAETVLINPPVHVEQP